MTTELSFPKVIDSSIRSSFVSCPRQFFYSHFLHLRRPEPSVHLHFGKCFASALETTRLAFWGEGISAIPAVAKGCTKLIQQWGDWEPSENIVNSRAGVKTLEAALDAFLTYWERFPLGQDGITPLMIEGRPCVEMSFALPIPHVRHPDGDPLIYAGRFDMIGHFNNALFIVDEKTTTQLGSAWRSNWTLRGQLSGYAWGARSYGVEAAGCIIRGVGIMKQSIQFEEAILSRPPWQVDQWLNQLQRDCTRMLQLWHRMKQFHADAPHEAWDQSFDSACTAYGGCGYVDLCDTPEPHRFYGDYVRQPWNPLDRGD